MPTIFALIEADDGTTENVFIGAGDRDTLLTMVADAYAYTCEQEEIFDDMDNKAFIASQRNALLAMLSTHEPWTPGRYVLPCIEPIWRQWTLMIV